MERAGPGIALDGIHLRLGERQLVRGLSGRVESGEFLALAGPSGSGKTTLLQVMAGFLRPDRGRRQWILGEDSSFGRLPVDRIGFVYQHLRLARQLTALTAVATGALGRLSSRESLFGFPRAVRQAAWRELSDIGLAEAAHAVVGRLSGGERQRVAMARTLLQAPDIYFVDEPVANLDRANAQLILARLRREASERGKTVVAVLHDETQIGLFADRVLRWDGREAAAWKFERLRSGKR
jgi:phosphonate transport system ATP-binding protein